MTPRVHTTTTTKTTLHMHTSIPNNVTHTHTNTITHTLNTGFALLSDVPSTSPSIELPKNTRAHARTVEYDIYTGVLF